MATATEEQTAEVVDFSFADPFMRLTKDVKQASRNLTRADARWLVDEYYLLQHNRIAAAAQERSSYEDDEPHRLVAWVNDTFSRFETAVKASMGEFAATYRVGQWCQAQYGIGPVLSAAMLCNFDIRKAPTVGHFWRFAGLDPSCKWLGKEKAKALLKELEVDETLTPNQAEAINKACGQHTTKIINVFQNGFKAPNGNKMILGASGVVRLLSVLPWNAKLKAICAYRMGECFVKFCNKPDCYYGNLYALKKAKLTEINEAGAFTETAAERVSTVGKTTEAYKAYAAGVLPKAQIHNRARRWAVKIFISHLHRVMYEDFYGKEPPAPYIFEHPNGTDHRHLLEPPLWPGDGYSGRPLKKLLKD